MELSNKIFGRWTVISRDSQKHDKFRTKFWNCKCDCGKIKSISQRVLLQGKSKSCGCLKSEINSQNSRKNFTIHGMSKCPEYFTWRRIKNRCYNTNSNDYKYYGGRGILIYKKWLDNFIEFFNYIKINLGDKPSEEYSIDRINNNGNYEPGNLRWATIKQQRRNRNFVRKITFNGKTQTLPEWGEDLNINYKTLKKRIKDGWNIEKVLTTPLKKY